MWPTIFSINRVLSILLTGIVIKIMDDYLDQDIDAILGSPGSLFMNHYGSLPYALLIFSLACTLDIETSASLFLASFSVGMAGNFTAVMPSGLYGYQESLGSLLFGFLFFGGRCIISSLCIIITIQLLDDWIDYERDWALKNNWGVILGKVESLLLAVIFFLVAIYFDLLKSSAVIISYLVIVYIIQLLSTNINPR